MVTYTFEKAKYNGVDGYFASRFIDGSYAGKQFGKTKEEAASAFDEE